MQAVLKPWGFEDLPYSTLPKKEKRERKEERKRGRKGERRQREGGREEGTSIFRMKTHTTFNFHLSVTSLRGFDTSGTPTMSY